MSGQPEWQNPFLDADMPWLDEAGHFAQPIDPMLSRLHEAGFPDMQNELVEASSGDLSIPPPGVLDTMSWVDLAFSTESGRREAVDAAVDSACRVPDRPMAPFMPRADGSYDFGIPFDFDVPINFTAGGKGNATGDAMVAPSARNGDWDPDRDDRDWRISEWMKDTALTQGSFEGMAQQNGTHAHMPHVFVLQTPETHAKIAEVLKRTGDSESSESSSRSKRAKMDLAQPHPTRTQQNPSSARNTTDGMPFNPQALHGSSTLGQAQNMNPVRRQLQLQKPPSKPGSATQSLTAVGQNLPSQTPLSGTNPALPQHPIRQQREVFHPQRQAAINESSDSSLMASGAMSSQPNSSIPIQQRGMIRPPILLAQASNQTPSNQTILLPSGKCTSMGHWRAYTLQQRQSQMVKPAGTLGGSVVQHNQTSQQRPQQRPTATQMMPNTPVSMRGTMSQQALGMPSMAAMHTNAAARSQDMAQPAMSHTQSMPSNAASSTQLGSPATIPLTPAAMPPALAGAMNNATSTQSATQASTSDESGSNGASNLRGGGRMGPPPPRTPGPQQSPLVDQYTGMPFTPGPRATGHIIRGPKRDVIANRRRYAPYPPIPMPYPMQMPMHMQMPYGMPMPMQMPPFNPMQNLGPCTPVPMIPTGLTPTTPVLPDDEKYPPVRLQQVPSNMPLWPYPFPPPQF